MLSFGHGAFETRVEGVARKEGKGVRLSREPGVGAVVVDDGLESRDAADGLCGSCSMLVLALVVRARPGLSFGYPAI